MFFYLALPFISHGMLRAGVAKRREVLWGLGLLIYGVSLVVACRLRNTMVPYSLSWWLVYISPYFRLGDFAIGAIAGFAFLAAPRPPTPPGAASTRATGQEVLSLVLLVLVYRFRELTYDTVQIGLLYLPPIVFVIFVFARQAGHVSRALSGRAFRHLGEISYSIYMLHFLVISYVTRFLAPDLLLKPVGMARFLGQAAVVAATLALSDLLYRYYEKPLRSLLRKGFARILPAR
jgi:peptidoglycan/LPS O-acetylase OafA/YrhL